MIAYYNPEHTGIKQYNLEPLKEWKDILCRLQRGQAVLKGRYHLNNSSRILDDIIIVRAEQEDC